MSLDVYLETPSHTCPTCNHEHGGEYHYLEARRQWDDARSVCAKYTVKARDLIEQLRAGLDRLRADPQRFKEYNPKNGWGDYEGLVRFTANYLAACEEHPDAVVRVSR